MKILLTLTLTFTISLQSLNFAKEDTMTKALEKVASHVQLETGDIIFTNGQGVQAEAVKAATDSDWTHTGVIIIEKGTPMVLEAVQPVQFISLNSYLSRGGGKYTHIYKRLKDNSKLTPEAQQKAATWAKKHLGGDYDGRFLWSDKNLYCSELVWKIYQASTGIELCKIRRVREYKLEHPKVQSLIKARFGSIDRLKLDEKVVAPSDVFHSPLLVEIKPEK